MTRPCSVEAEEKAVEAMKDGPRKQLRVKALQAAQKAAAAKAEEAEAKRHAAALEEEDRGQGQQELDAGARRDALKAPVFDPKWQKPKAAAKSSWGAMREKHLSNAIQMKKAGIAKHIPASMRPKEEEPKGAEEATAAPEEPPPDSYEAAVGANQAAEKRAAWQGLLREQRPKAEFRLAT